MAKKKQPKQPVLTAEAKKTALDRVIAQRAEARVDTELERVKGVLSSSPITRNMRVDMKRESGQSDYIYLHSIIEKHGDFKTVRAKMIEYFEEEETRKLMDDITDWKHRSQ